MAKKQLYMNGELTFAEKEVLFFLHNNKGTGFTNDEIEEATGIQVTYINTIVNNLKIKGYDIATAKRSGKHEYIYNNLLSYLLTVTLMLFILFIFIFAGLDYLAADPTVYEVEPIIER